MSEQDENEVEASSADVRFYLPCPVCRNAVSVCGTTFVALTD
jgi:hypothetical protein